MVLDAFNQVRETNKADNEAINSFTLDAVPVLSLPGAVSTSEGMPLLVNFTVSDEETPADQLVVTCSSSNSALLPAEQFVLSRSGNACTIRISPTALAAGVSDVVVTVQDSAGAETAAHMQVTVTPVNNLPAMTPIADVSVPKHGHTVPLPFIVSDPDNAASDLTVTAATTNPEIVPLSGIVLAGSGAQRTVQITPADHVTGISMVTLTVSDGSGTYSSSFHVTVTPVNDPPVFNLIPSLQVPRDAGPQRLPGVASAIAPGGPDESSQTVSFAAVAATPGLFLAQPALDPVGTLTFTPSPVASGSSVITVTSHDSAGGVSVPQTFTITVTSIVDAVGSYHGLVTPLAPLSSRHAGAFSFTLTPGGAATGHLVLGGAGYAMLAQVDNSGEVTFPAARGGATLRLTRGVEIALHVDVAGSSGTMTGTLSSALGGAPFATILAERDYSPLRFGPIPAGLVGKYSARVRGLATGPQYPYAEGKVRLRVTPAGGVRLAGRLADGQPVAAAGRLSFRQQWPLYTDLYARRGSLSGWIDLSASSNLRAASSSDLLWFRPALPGHKPLHAGWPGGLRAEMVGE